MRKFVLTRERECGEDVGFDLCCCDYARNINKNYIPQVKLQFSLKIFYSVLKQ